MQHIGERVALAEKVEDPLAAAKGVFRGTALGVIFWVALGAFVTKALGKF